MEKHTVNGPEFTQKLESFMEALGLTEEPMGIFYTDKKPVTGFTPKAQIPLSRLPQESNGEVNWISCVLGKVRRARREKAAAYFDQEHYGCLGGAFFMGLKPYYEEFEPALLSTGIPDKMEGERYVDSPETGKAFYDGFKPPKATAPVLVIQPLSLFKEEEQPETVVFFPNRETMIGLNALTVFITRDPDAVRMPFGVGCCGLISWPIKFLRQGKTKSVIGGFDINCLKYLKENELTYTIPFDLFLEMLEKWPQSMVGTKTWKRIMK